MNLSIEDLIDGTEIKIGRINRVVPPLNFKQLRRLAPQLATLSAMSSTESQITDEQYAAMLDVVHAALMRNYPNLSREDLEEDFDLANAPKILSAVMARSGLDRSGEAKPGQ